MGYLRRNPVRPVSALARQWGVGGGLCWCRQGGLGPGRATGLRGQGAKPVAGRAAALQVLLAAHKHAAELDGGRPLLGVLHVP